MRKAILALAALTAIAATSGALADDNISVKRPQVQLADDNISVKRPQVQLADDNISVKRPQFA